MEKGSRLDDERNTTLDILKGVNCVDRFGDVILWTGLRPYRGSSCLDTGILPGQGEFHERTLLSHDGPFTWTKKMSCVLTTIRGLEGKVLLNDFS